MLISWPPGHSGASMLVGWTWESRLAIKQDDNFCLTFLALGKFNAWLININVNLFCTVHGTV